MHCERPPCIEVCVSGATYKNEENGLVLVDQDACIGCGFCVDACPYNVRYLDEKCGVVDKCNACLQRVEIGKMPACVATCLGGARLFGDFNDSESTVSRALKDARIIHRVEYQKGGKDTDPNIFFINGGIGETIQIANPVMMDETSLPRDPKYTLAEEGWKRVFVPAIAVGIGASFLVQAVYFTKQLLEGEKEFDE